MDQFPSDPHSANLPARHERKRPSDVEGSPIREAASLPSDHPHRVHPGVLTSLAAVATALLASAGVLVDRGALMTPLSLAPAALTVALMTLGAGLAAITISAAWQGRSPAEHRSRGVGRIPGRADIVRQPLDQGSHRPPL